MSHPASGDSDKKPESYRLSIKRLAAKAIESLSDAEQDQIDEAIQDLAREPRSSNSKKITGYLPLRRLKLPSFRIIYVVDEGEREVLILLVERRADNTYKRLDRLIVGLKQGTLPKRGKRLRQ